MNIQRHLKRLTGALAFGGLTAVLSGCVVAPVGYDAYGGYPSGQVYIAPPPIVVAPGFYGHRGYRGGYGHRGYRGYRGHGYWR
jgi:hypothetical protein